MIPGALIPALGFVPGHVIGYASTAGFGLLSGASGTDFSLPTGPFTVMAVSFVIGGLYGYVGSILVGRLVSSRSTACGRAVSRLPQAGFVPGVIVPT